MATFEEISNKTPVVVFLDNVGPYCLRVKEELSKLEIPADKITWFYVDSEANGSQIQEEAESKEIAESKSLPHIYLKGKFFYGGEDVEEISDTCAMRNKLAGVGAITLPELENTQQLIKSTKLVVFLNKFSAYCCEARQILTKYVPETNVNVRLVYTDEDTKGEDIEKAAHFLADTVEFPILFMNEEPFGSLRRLQELDNDWEMWDVLGEAGVITPIPHERLQTLKTSYGILMIGNDYSPFSLQVEELLNNMQLPSGVLKIVNDSTVETKGLERAAMLDFKASHGPYVYINGEQVPTKVVLKYQKDDVLNILKEKGLIE